MNKNKLFFSSVCLADTSEFVGTILLYVFNILSFSTKVSVLRTWACFSVCKICQHKVIWSHPSKRWKRTRNTTVCIQKLLVEVAKIIDKYTIFPSRAAETSSREWKSKTFQCRTDWNPFSGLIGLITFPFTLESFYVSVLIFIVAYRRTCYFFKFFPLTLECLTVAPIPSLLINFSSFFHPGQKYVVFKGWSQLKTLLLLCILF